MKQRLEQNKEVALCRICRKRYYGFPEQCNRCGNTKFRRAGLRKEEHIIMELNMIQMNQNHVNRDGAFELMFSSESEEKKLANANMQSLSFCGKKELICPNCNSKDIKKKGFRKTKYRGEIQKYECKKCNKFFVPKDELWKRKYGYEVSFLPNEFYESENNNYEFLKRNSITGEEHSVNGEVGKMIYRHSLIKSPCPFCYSKILEKLAIRTNQYGKDVVQYKCINCKKSFCQRNYRNKKTPEYVIDLFIELFSSKKFYSARELTEIIFKEVGFKISVTTIYLWQKQYRKGKLWKKYLPNSRLNCLIKPDIEYIPKVVIYNVNKNVKNYKVKTNYANPICC